MSVTADVTENKRDREPHLWDFSGGDKFLELNTKQISSCDLE